MGKRIGLYGGTFDPVHIGHTGVARGLIERFALDAVIFIPAYVAPHKREAGVTPALHRHAMLALATQEDARLLVSTIELDAPERPYTVETLSRIKEQQKGAQLFFVMGADSWMEITTWRDWERLLTLANHIVVTRPGYELSTDHVTTAIGELIVDLRRARNSEESARTVEESERTRIYITDAVNMEVSATEIRRAVRARADEEWSKWVAPPVADYIRKYGLYREV